MTNTLQKYEDKQLKKLAEGKKVDEFAPGDTIRVNVKIVEGTNERIQAFEGVCIARKSRGINSSFTVRKISHGEGVERVFPLHSPFVDSVKLIRTGSVRRAKLYYMRTLTGKAARIEERQDLVRLGLVSASEVNAIATAADAQGLDEIVVQADAEEEKAKAAAKAAKAEKKKAGKAASTANKKADKKPKSEK